jgi:GntR family transcriptional repressor for pyruvate dehydrogenase complex
MKLKPVQRSSLVSEVVDRLRQSIERGKLTSGDQLPPEPELIAQLGVSRTVLREAICRLQSLGLVTVKRGLGTFVAERDDLGQCVRMVRSAMTLTSAELIRFAELREALEIYAARQAAERATPEDVAALDAICQRMEEENNEQALQDDLEFHLRIVQIMGNPLILSVLEVIQQFIIEGMLRTTPRPRQRLVSRRYHMAIVDAIRHGDAQAAETAIKDHMTILVRRLQEAEKPARRQSSRAE